MSYLKFNKEELVNLEYSLKREVVFSNKTGSYFNSTIVCCNNRKYHGLFVIPIDKFGGKRHILLSSLDETLIQHDQSFNLGIHCYGDLYDPRGHKYIVDFELDRSLTITYRVGGMLLSKSIIFAKEEDQLLIKYTLVESNFPTKLRLRPFMLFRDIHLLTHANPDANTKFVPVQNGAAFRMYDEFPTLYLQLNKINEYIHSPDWYYGVEYREEKRRGYESKEDLFTPGFFEFNLSQGESVIFSASVNEESTKGLKRKYDKEFEKIISRDSFDSCLKIAEEQFIVKRMGRSFVVAGYSWMGSYMRESLIALPGLTLFNSGDEKNFKEVLDTLLKERKAELLEDDKMADAPLWMAWVMQQYLQFTSDKDRVWSNYGKILRDILNSYMKNVRSGVILKDNGLLWCEDDGIAHSWMNACVEGEPVTPRAGFQVETNALWYNALCFAIEMESGLEKRSSQYKKWVELKEKLDRSYVDVFWSEEKSYLADYVDNLGQNVFVRPNQLFAAALPYSPLTDSQKDKVLKTIEKELLTVRGIRTLSPKNPQYKGEYEGNQAERDMAYHQGSTRTWLLGFFIDASLQLYGKSFVNKAEKLVNAFEEDVNIHGVGSVAELYDGDPPHYPHGAISHSVAVAELVRAKYLIRSIK